MKKWIFISITVLSIVLFFIFKNTQKSVRPLSVQTLQEKIERGDSRRIDLWTLKIDNSLLKSIHLEAVKCIALNSEAIIGDTFLIFSVDQAGALYNFQMDPQPLGVILDQTCLTKAYQSLSSQLASPSSEQWGRDRLQASDF